ncbi:hypothetical protein IE077_000928 [Cardiosporidium cionae]|uniref:Uncharacterized protein n=1 Tax=Cardiosporidium cionae TaxID=476202 RepID=A0ABQ7J699_9APIC|nr:hypothetical protein IE077_000928 [Cardiosporidium cionae]|eukprot:KAF8819502.1 hypothetical protein IE077_000928 [Cardiosporidium cionae]
MNPLDRMLFYKLISNKISWKKEVEKLPS